MREGCRFPGNAPRTAYGKGCRCGGCREWARVRRRRYREANPEKIAEENRRYREANPEKLAESRRRRRESRQETDRRYREANPGASRRRWAQLKDAYLLAAKPIVTGRYSPAEDAVILSWEGRVIDLAVALGRTYYSVRARRQRLTETPT